MTSSLKRIPHRAGTTALLAFLLATSACAAPINRVPSGPAPAAESRIYDVHGRRYISMAQLVDAVSSADVVFFGEQHDDPATHRAELALLARLGAAKNVVLSLEMFERDVQTMLDRYLAGAITDSVFMATSRPWPNYVKDYRPLVELARANGWPVVASNVPRRIASAVSRAGLALLDTMPAADRAFVARDRSCPHDRYFELFAEEMSGHSAGGVAADTSGAGAMTQRFYESQCTKDETMAESIVQALDHAGDGTVVVHYNGAFHSNSRLGTVSRVVRRRPAAKAVVITAVPVDAAERPGADEYVSLGDYIVLVPTPSSTIR